jgi:TP901 family phage tail tape measure protein
MAASATVGILRVLLSANTAEFEAAMDSAGKSVKQWEGTFNKIGQQATAAGAILTSAFTVPLAALGAGSAKAAMDFETSFANVAKTVDGVADNAGKLTPVGQALAQTFRDLAKEIPATTTELTQIAALGGQMGVPIDQLELFTKNGAALGVAVDGISTEEAAMGLAQIGNISGEGSTKVAEMASALVHLGNNSSATEAQILEFTKRLMGAGDSVGMTVPQVMALGTSMANLGINAEAGGTAMSQVITKISVAVSEGGTKLEEFARVAGMSAQQFAEVWQRSPIEAIQAFIGGLSTMKERGVDLNLTMGELGTEGIRVSDTLKRMAGDSEGLGRALVIANEGFSAGNAHLTEAEKKYATA